MGKHKTPLLALQCELLMFAVDHGCTDDGASPDSGTDVRKCLRSRARDDTSSCNRDAIERIEDSFTGSRSYQTSFINGKVDHKSLHYVVQETVS